MARVTVEDCLRNVQNRFELVILAAKRARQLMRGKEPRVEWDNDKATVVALREIAKGHTQVSNEPDPREAEAEILEAIEVDIEQEVIIIPTSSESEGIIAPPTRADVEDEE